MDTVLAIKLENDSVIQMAGYVDTILAIELKYDSVIQR